MKLSGRATYFVAESGPQSNGLSRDRPARGLKCCTVLGGGFRAKLAERKQFLSSLPEQRLACLQVFPGITKSSPNLALC